MMLSLAVGLDRGCSVLKLWSVDRRFVAVLIDALFWCRSNRVGVRWASFGNIALIYRFVVQSDLRGVVSHDML